MTLDPPDTPEPTDAAHVHEDAQSAARREAEARQLRALHGALQGRRLLVGDLQAMIRLGIVTDDERRLPCHSVSRHVGLAEWEERHRAGPRGRTEAPRTEANQVRCPLLGPRPPHSGEPPCIEAQGWRGRVAVDWRSGGLRFHPTAMDAADPVVRARLRPCVTLGRELFQAIMSPVWLRRQEDDDEQ